MKSFSVSTGLVGLFLVTLSYASLLVVHEKRGVPLPKSLERRQIEKHALLPMRIGLRQNKHAELNAEKWIMVSKMQFISGGDSC